MKILYSIQATGNGHISRAMELLPYMQQYGHIDLFLSGANSTLNLDWPVKYRSKGLSLFYTCRGTLDYWKLSKNVAPLRIAREVRDLPVERYDLVINDFECITALACAYKHKTSLNFGHQASFMSPKTPRPDKPHKLGEWVLRNYARASHYVGLHFQGYDDFIINPVIKHEIVWAEPKDRGYIAVYLPSYCEHELIKFLKPLKDFRFMVFSAEAKQRREQGNVTFLQVDKHEFNKSLINCSGIITGAGFETPAEALYLKKKIIAIPIRGQYEQLCNAAALQKLGVRTPGKLDDDFDDTFNEWINDPRSPQVEFPYSVQAIVDFLMTTAATMDNSKDYRYPDISFS